MKSETPEAVGAAMSREADQCIPASHKIHGHFFRLTEKIDRMQDPSVRPDELLPVDIFLDGMLQRKNAPRIVWKPKQCGTQLWAANMHAWLYYRIEKAFVSAGLMPGCNGAGYRKKLVRLRDWAKNSPQTVPEHFVHKTTRLFAKGLLKERREERVGVLFDIKRHSPPRHEDLKKLIDFVDADLNEDILLHKGRPVEYQRIMFAVEMANLWSELTGREAANGPDTNFHWFVKAAWQSGFEDMIEAPTFKRILRERIEEVPNPTGDQKYRAKIA